MPLIIFPLAMVAMFVASEMIMSSRSRWKELSGRYRKAASPGLRWRGCSFVQVEFREGNVIYRTSFGRSRFSLQAQLFPPVSVAVDSKGLHLKRLPWHFMHPPLMIPWTAVVEIQTMSARDFDADKAARQMGMSAQALRARGARMPGEMSAVMQFSGGSVTTVTLANPRMLLSVPANCIEDAKRFLPQRPVAPSSGSSEPDKRSKAGIGVRSFSS
jgi:hypothetical protein